MSHRCSSHGGYTVVAYWFLLCSYVSYVAFVLSLFLISSSVVFLGRVVFCNCVVSWVSPPAPSTKVIFKGFPVRFPAHQTPSEKEIGPFWKGSLSWAVVPCYSKWKDFAPYGCKVSPYRVDLFSEESKTIVSCLLWTDIHFEIFRLKR